MLVVSHSRRLADGMCELLGEMARGVRLAALGGEPPALGVAVEAVAAALGELLGEVGEVVVVADLGSSVLAAEAAVGLSGAGERAVVLRGVPMLEGAVAASMALAVGGGLADAVAAAKRACEEIGAGP